MANVVTSQILQDGARNVVMLFTGLLDTSDEAKVVKVDVSALVPSTARLRVDRIQFSVTEGMTLIMDWDATADVNFATLTGVGCLDARDVGGLTNNAGAGVTGDIEFSTAGWGSGTKCYTVLMWMVKERLA